MPAQLVKLRTKADRLKTDQAEQLRQLVLDFPDLPQRAVGELIATIDRQTASREWMDLRHDQPRTERRRRGLAVQEQRPAPGRHAALGGAVQQPSHRHWRDRADPRRTGGVGCETPNHVSEIMGELATIGAISRRREKVAGMRGPGLVRYFMNPKVGTHLTGAARDKAQTDSAPLLALINGGRAPS